MFTSFDISGRNIFGQWCGVDDKVANYQKHFAPFIGSDVANYCLWTLHINFQIIVISQNIKISTRSDVRKI